MKFLASEIAYLLTNRENRANLRALSRYLLFLAALVALFTVMFHVIKLNVEGERHSWITGLYWTLVVMTTLGFGDITFSSDVGRAFSIVVLLSGVVFLLVMLPFLFVRLFYAPWLEARVRLRAPRRVRDDLTGHVIISEHDAVAAGLLPRLAAEGIPHVVVEPDPATAAQLVGDGVAVVTGETDSRTTYEQLRTTAARLVLANCEDTTNTNITLTVREVAPDVPIVAIVEEDDSVDILSLSGANMVLPLKRQLGEYLANRVDAGRAEAHVVGSFGELQIAEMAARDTPFSGTSVRDTRLRERTGASIVGLWARGRLRPAYPHTVIEEDHVVVVAGTGEHITALNGLLPGGRRELPLVLVIGLGKVGEAAARALTRKGLSVRAIDRDADVVSGRREDEYEAIAGDANDRRVLQRAGIGEAASVLLTTNDDAMNIYLAVYCRRLSPRVRIVSRITHERNVEAIHRAGADFVLSYTSLGVEAVMSLLQGHEPVLLGEGVRLFSIPVPRGIADRPLRDSGIGSLTGMTVVGLREQERIVTALTSETILRSGSELLLLGSTEQRSTFAELFEQRAKRSARTNE